MSNFSEAVKFAKKAHKGQTRKGSNAPYIEHPLEVVEIVKTMTDDEDIWSAAILHDTVEDTEVTQEDIYKKFGKRISELVASNTENKRESLPASETWKIRKQETLDRLSGTKDLAEKIIVLADKLSNIRQLANDYAREGESVWKKFNQKDKNEHKWYYESILEATEELREYEAWREYSNLVKNIFS